MWAPFRTFPLGLGGIMDDVKTFKTVEDWATEIMDSRDPDECALLYKALYSRGYRISTCDAQIAKLQKRLG